MRHFYGSVTVYILSYTVSKRVTNKLYRFFHAILTTL